MLELAGWEFSGLEEALGAGAFVYGDDQPDELLRGKGQMRGSVVMGLEDTGANMTRIA